ncbi:MAG: glutamate--tRNA ligase [Acidobacteria bacterium RIFCSPLOWO2_02_FULL_65_29]|nr:MAG: glutamate--tRNA ligase [Acidobacteria bacterium RIFCSPLOWO2_02_FULL_65_29]
MRLRFAPSPTGQLHVGNARTALFNWLLARGSGAELVLRVEDTDAGRSTAESEAAILRDLRWLGLDWNEGPDVGGPCGPYRQSERLHLYHSYAKEMVGVGRAYPCFCAPAQLETDRAADLAAGRPVRYSGRCRQVSPSTAERRIASGERPAIRFRVPEEREIVFDDAVRGDMRFRTDVIGDPIILRADGTPAYNFAVVIDDALMAITHVIRGEDHLSNTPRQILLYETLGFRPPTFAHLSLVLGPDHAPLSKRHGATSVAEFRAKGYLPEALVNYLALVGWSPAEGGAGPELMPALELARRFSLDAVGHSAGVFDEEKLAWVNRQYLKIAEPTRLADLSVSFFRGAGVPMTPNGEGLAFLAAAMPIASGSVDRLDQVPARLSFLFDYLPERTLADPLVGEEMRSEAARAVVRALAEQLATAPRLDRERFRAAANDVKIRTGQRARALFHPIRVALTGRAEGPELDLSIPAIDRGADLPSQAGLPSILGCRERAAAFAAALDQQT